MFAVMGTRPLGNGAYVATCSVHGDLAFMCPSPLYASLEAMGHVAYFHPPRPRVVVADAADT